MRGSAALNLTLPSTLTSIASLDLAALISGGCDLAGRRVCGRGALHLGSRSGIEGLPLGLARQNVHARRVVGKAQRSGGLTGRGSSAITRPMVNNWPSIRRPAIRREADRLHPPLNCTQFDKLAADRTIGATSISTVRRRPLSPTPLPVGGDSKETNTSRASGLSPNPVTISPSKECLASTKPDRRRSLARPLSHRLPSSSRRVDRDSGNVRENAAPFEESQTLPALRVEQRSVRRTYGCEPMIPKGQRPAPIGTAQLRARCTIRPVVDNHRLRRRQGWRRAVGERDRPKMGVLCHEIECASRDAGIRRVIANGPREKS